MLLHKMDEFNEYDILHFWDNVHLLKHYAMIVPKKWINLLKCLNQTGIKKRTDSNFS